VNKLTKLQQLIKELCPNGVEYKSIEQLCEVFTGGEAPSDCIKGAPPDDIHKYPVYSNGTNDNAIYGYSANYVIDKRAVTFSSIGTIGHPTIRDAKFTPIIRLKVIIPKDDTVLNVGFLRYVLEVVEFAQNKSSVPNINAKMIKSIEIPIPPLPVQEEIVRILDELTEKTNKLILELNAELEKRKKQYEFYLEKLLTSSNDAEFRLLGEMSCFFNGDRGKNYPKTSEMVAEGIPFINAGDINGPDIDYINCNKITKEKYSTMSGAKLKKGDILYCLRGSTGKNGIYDLDEGTVASSLVAIRANQKVNGKFLYYLLNSSLEKTQRIKYDTGAAQPNLSAKNVREYVFPVPSIKEQNRITSILDDLHYYHQNISETLRAEITVQKKRYEHYRDKLLTF